MDKELLKKYFAVVTFPTYISMKNSFIILDTFFPATFLKGYSKLFERHLANKFNQSIVTNLIESFRMGTSFFRCMVYKERYDFFLDLANRNIQRPNYPLFWLLLLPRIRGQSQRWLFGKYSCNKMVAKTFKSILRKLYLIKKEELTQFERNRYVFFFDNTNKHLRRNRAQLQVCFILLLYSVMLSI